MTDETRNMIAKIIRRNDDPLKLYALFEEAIKEERETCARIAEAPFTGQPHTEFARGRGYAANEIAKAIRARNTKAA